MGSHLGCLPFMATIDRIGSEFVVSEGREWIASLFSSGLGVSFPFQ